MVFLQRLDAMALNLQTVRAQKLQKMSNQAWFNNHLTSRRLNKLTRSLKWSKKNGFITSIMIDSDSSVCIGHFTIRYNTKGL